MRFLMFAAAMFLTACGQSATAPEAPATESAPVAYAPLKIDTLNIACDATYQYECRDRNCSVADGFIPVAFSFNGPAGTGSFCMATGCSDVFLTPIPADAPSPGDDIMAAVLSPGAPETAGAGPGPFLEGVVSLKRDGSAFQFVQSGTLIWGGTCHPAPAEAPQPG